MKCKDCPLRDLELFDAFTQEEIAFTEKFKAGELHIDPGAPVISEGTRTPHLFTVLQGIGLRYSTLEDGRRQVLNFVFPGDMIGLQGAMLSEMGYSVEAKTEMTLCVFPRERFWELFKTSPERAYDVTWLAAREECILSNSLLSVGQMTGLEKVAFTLLTLYRRYRDLGLTDGERYPRHFTQGEIADTVGLSVVHTNKLLARLRRDDIAIWGDEAVTITNMRALMKLAHLETLDSRKRPLI